MDQEQLISEFDAAMHDTYRRAYKEAGYKAAIFIRMLLDRGGLETARRLSLSPTISEGYTALFERNRLDLTVEAVVYDNERWHSLLSEEELARCRTRLIDFEYLTLGKA